MATHPVAEGAIGPDAERFGLGRALRPFSFVVALITCALGVLLAWQDGYQSPFRGALVLAGALLAQAGVNLINDRGDLGLLKGLSPQGRHRILRNYRWGMACLLGATLAAGYLIWQVGWPLLLLCLLGLIGALGYTTEPIHYKRRGLGVVLVFWLMGVLMVGGAYLAMSGRWPLSVVAQAVPPSLLTALLLLSNELRDWESDKHRGVGTLVVRVGFQAGQGLYLLLLLGTYLSLPVLYQQQLLGHPLLLAPSLILVPSLVRHLQGSREQRRFLPPLTGRFFALFGGLYLLAMGLNP